jgi:hypothetical protein
MLKCGFCSIQTRPSAVAFIFRTASRIGNSLSTLIGSSGTSCLRGDSSSFGQRSELSHEYAVQQTTADGRTVISFNTSAINQLADDPHGDALIAGLTAGHFVRFPFTTISEIIATSKGERRAQLLRVARKLLASGDCIEPHHEMMRVMVARFEKSLPLGLQHVYLRMNEAEDEVRRSQNFDDDLAAQEREDTLRFHCPETTNRSDR